MREEVICCSLDNWLAAYQPFEPTEGDVDAGMQALGGENQKKRGQGRASNRAALLDGGEWVEFSTPPSSGRESENEVFQHLEDIADRLASVKLAKDSESSSASPSAQEGALSNAVGNHVDPNTARRHSTAQWSYRSDPNSAIPGEQSENTNLRVDGYFHRTPLEGTLSLADVSVILEYKKRREDDVQNRRQLVRAASHLLNGDPRRFAVYGITIEGSDVSLWYFCRSHTAMSYPFSFMENPRVLVKVFISFLFANSESSGYDGNIRRVWSSPNDDVQSISYVYRMAGEEAGRQRARYYRTRRAICEPHRLCITGRGTRVWEAEQVKSFDDLERVDDRVVVLREVWLDEGARTERQIQQRIFASLEEFGERLKKTPSYRPPHFSDWGEDLEMEIRALFEEGHSHFPSSSRSAAPRKAYEKFFLTIREDFLGQSTRAIGKDYQTGSMLLRKLRYPRSPTSAGVAGADPPRQYQLKRPYRLVYEENCLDLDDSKVTSLEDIFIGLRGCFTGESSCDARQSIDIDPTSALVLLFCAGWVHRDISCGNVLIWTDDRGRKHGKLADLEYAKQFPSQSGSPSPKMGTAYFMPVEIMLGRWVASKATAQKKRRLNEPLTKPLTAKELAEIELEGALLPADDRNASQSLSDPLQHHFVHEMECFWWLSLWSITCKVGNWDYLKDIFVPLMTENTGERRRCFLTEDENYHFTSLVTGLPPSFRPIFKRLQVARKYLGHRLGELGRLDETQRRNPAEYSYAYQCLRGLVTADIPTDAPALVKGSNPFWRIASDEEMEALEAENPHLKRPASGT